MTDLEVTHIAADMLTPFQKWQIKIVQEMKEPMFVSIPRHYASFGSMATAMARAGQAGEQASKSFRHFSEVCTTSLCQNRKVVHLAFHARKWRTRKKNINRAKRIIAKDIKR